MNGELAQAIEREADNIPLQIGFKRLSENAVIPTKAHASDSGWDLFAAEDVVISPGDTRVIATDIAVVLPEGYEAQVRPRSGVTSKTKLRVQLGTIDNAYRGNIGIIVDNIAETGGYLLNEILTVTREKVSAGKHVVGDYGYNGKGVEVEEAIRYPQGTYLIRRGDKIAQLVVQQLPQTMAVEITELSESDRGTDGFGSSGI